MPVVYRYKNESRKTIEAGRSFEVVSELVNISQWQLTAKADSILDGITYLVIAIPLFDSNSIIPIEQIPNYVDSFYYPNTFTADPGNRWQFRNNGQIYQFYTYGQWENSVHFNPTEGRAISTRATGILYEWREEYIYRFTGRKIYVFPDSPYDYFWYPANGTQLWILKIFDRDGIQIFSRTDIEKPIELYYVQPTCPNNTCAVDCGDQVCCYGIDGIAIDYYLK